MRSIFLIITTIISISSLSAQIYEVGVFAGGSNFVGDVGSTRYISPNQAAFGIIGKWNRSPRHTYRFSAIYTNLEGQDSKSDDPRRQQRNYSFENDIIELSAGLEFNFFDFDQHDIATKGTPYLYSGISFARFENYYFDASGTIQSENSKSWAIGIPITLGYKALLSPHFVLAAEVGARYTVTDEIDGSLPDADFRQQFAFGNTNSDDWYVFTGITITYTFGQKPCYCNF